jgi:hypothetical protein
MGEQASISDRADRELTRHGIRQLKIECNPVLDLPTSNHLQKR